MGFGVLEEHIGFWVPMERQLEKSAESDMENGIRKSLVRLRTEEELSMLCTTLT